MNWVWLFCDDFVQSFTPVRSNFHFLIFYIYLLDYFQMSMLASLRRSSSRGHNTVGVESLMGSFVLAGLMEGPVLVEVAAGAQGAQPQYSLGTGQTPAGAGYLQDAECGFDISI